MRWVISSSSISRPSRQARASMGKTSAPRPPLSALAAATASSRLAFTPRAAPMRCASSSLASSMSTAMIFAAPASRAPCTAASPTAPDHHHRIGVADMGDVERRADARHHAAADQAGAIERDVPRNRDRLLLLHDAVFAEGADEHQMLELFAACAPRLGGAIELHRLRTLGEIVLAQDREAAVAIVAVAAMRVPRQDDVIALLQLPHGGACLLDHPRGFMAEHDRHRIAQRAVDHFEIGVAKTRGAHAHQHVRWGERRGGDRLDLQRALRALQHSRLVVKGHGRVEAISYFAFLTSPFFTPASGKTHIAATMNTAVAMTKI